jgi:hypothetical protein
VEHERYVLFYLPCDEIKASVGIFFTLHNLEHSHKSSRV